MLVGRITLHVVAIDHISEITEKVLLQSVTVEEIVLLIENINVHLTTNSFCLGENLVVVELLLLVGRIGINVHAK